MTSLRILILFQRSYASTKRVWAPHQHKKLRECWEAEGEALISRIERNNSKTFMVQLVPTRHCAHMVYTCRQCATASHRVLLVGLHRADSSGQVKKKSHFVKNNFPVILIPVLPLDATISPQWVAAVRIRIHSCVCLHARRGMLPSFNSPFLKRWKWVLWQHSCLSMCVSVCVGEWGRSTKESHSEVSGSYRRKCHC